MSCSEVRGWTANQGASCGALQLEKFNPSDWKGPEGDESLPPLCCNLSPLCGRQIRLEQGAPRSILARCRRYHVPGGPGDAALGGPLFHKELTVEGGQT